jgi:uncharacterized membrane protein
MPLYCTCTECAIPALPGVLVSSWFGGVLLSVGEWIIRKVPMVKHIYSASKQIGAAVNPGDGQAKAFKECVIIKHPRHGEYAFAFITGETTLQVGGPRSSVKRR